MSNRKTKILRVGFDLDGVLLYNPARIVRPIIVFIKKIFIPLEKNKFHLPKNKWQKIIWLFLHKSSLMPASGYKNLKLHVENGSIEAYIVSGRYDSLKHDFKIWLKKLNAEKYFKSYYYNSLDEQPQIYKERMIKKLKLDYFIEDNWDIVNHLTNIKSISTKIVWIYNLLDRNVNYNYKFPNLKKAIEFIVNSNNK